MKKKAVSAKFKVWIHGISGRMGQEIAHLIANHDRLYLAGGSDKDTPPKTIQKGILACDIVIDFSSPDGSMALQKQMAHLTGKAVLIGTTGLSVAQIKKWSDTATNQKHRILAAANTSLGIYTLAQHVGALAALLAPEDFDIEIIETHHNKKIDAPSGTALFLAKMIQKDCPDFKLVFGHSKKRSPKTIGVHAVRGGGVFGEHEVRFIGAHEEIKITHRAFSRGLFANGALALALRLVKRKPFGLITVDQF